MKLDGEICIITVGLSGTGMQLGMLAPVMTLAMHLVFGAVLGGVYGAERPEPARGI